MIDTKNFKEVRLKTIYELSNALALATYGNEFPCMPCEEKQFPYDCFNKSNTIKIKIDKVFVNLPPVVCLANNGDISCTPIISPSRTMKTSISENICSFLCRELYATFSHCYAVEIPEDVRYEAIGEVYDNMENPYCIFFVNTETQTKYLMGSTENIHYVIGFIQDIFSKKQLVENELVVIEDSGENVVISISKDDIEIDHNKFLSDEIDSLKKNISQITHKENTPTTDSFVSYFVNEEDETLFIYLGENNLLATISAVDVSDNQIVSLVEDVLFGLGYIWNEDGSAFKFEEKLVEKISEASVSEKEDFLGYPISADILENIEDRIREILAQMPYDEIVKFVKKFLLQEDK